MAGAAEHGYGSLGTAVPALVSAGRSRSDCRAAKRVDALEIVVGALTYVSAMSGASAQLTTPRAPAIAPTLEALGVFKPNRRVPLHRWVSFTEGFSAQLVVRSLGDTQGPLTIYDPFGGTGTTPLVATQLGHIGAWSEVNPYLREATETKILAARSARHVRQRSIVALNEALLRGPAQGAVQDDHPLLVVNQNRSFFDPGVAEDVVAWLARFDSLRNELARRLGRLAVATSAVPCSNMKRAADLRRRTAAELTKPRPRVADVIRDQIADYCDDLRSTSQAEGSATLVSDDARMPPESLVDVDLVVTSPPYLNGTNYFRNTKLELLLLRMIETESDLRLYRAKAVTAGINNVSKRIAEPVLFRCIEPLACKLDDVTYDVRIPRMVRAYFADMAIVLAATRRVMRPTGRLVLDIGDSRFAGVHVDTPGLLLKLAQLTGWDVVDVEILRTRVGKDGGALCQKLLLLRPA
jgi:DNA modification methylase